MIRYTIYEREPNALQSRCVLDIVEETEVGDKVAVKRRIMRRLGKYVDRLLLLDDLRLADIDAIFVERDLTNKMLQGD